MSGQTSHASELDSATFDSHEEQSGIRERPKRAQRNSLPAFLSQESESDLRRYFRNGGSSATTRSTTAACLAIIEQRRKIAVPCETCGGDVATERPGTGFVNSKTFHRRPDEQTARAARGKPRRGAPSEKTPGLLTLLDDDAPSAAAAEQPAAPPLLLASPTPALDDLPAAFDGDMLCPDCDGRCWQVGAVSARRRRKSTRPIPKASPFRVTRPALDGLPNVYPLTSQDPPRGYELSEEMHADLTWLGKMSRWIMRLIELEPDRGEAALEVLGCYAAPDGGNVGALWHLVPAGRTMLRSNPLKLHHSQLFQNLREAQRQKYDEKRFLQFKAANEQAVKLFEWACTLWNSAGPKVESEDQPPEDHEAAVEAALAGETDESEARVPGVMREVVLASGRFPLRSTEEEVATLIGGLRVVEHLRIAPPALPSGELSTEEQQRFLDALSKEQVHVVPPGHEVEFIEPSAEALAAFQAVIDADPMAQALLEGGGIPPEPLPGFGRSVVGALATGALLKDFAKRDRQVYVEALVSRQRDPELDPELAYDPETKRITGRIPLGRPISAEQAEEWRAMGATEAPPNPATQPLFTADDDEPTRLGLGLELGDDATKGGV